MQQKQLFSLCKNTPDYEEKRLFLSFLDRLKKQYRHYCLRHIRNLIITEAVLIVFLLLATGGRAASGTFLPAVVLLVLIVYVLVLFLLRAELFFTLRTAQKEIREGFHNTLVSGTAFRFEKFEREWIGKADNRETIDTVTFTVCGSNPPQQITFGKSFPGFYYDEMQPGQAYKFFSIGDKKLFIAGLQ